MTTAGRRFQEIEGVLSGSASEHGLGIGESDERSFEEPGVLGLFEAAQEEGVCFLVKEEMSAEELESALGADRGSEGTTQDGCPASIIGRAVDGFLVGGLCMELENDEESQESGRDAGSSAFLVVEFGKVLVFKESGSGVSELGMKGPGIELEVVDVTNIE